eukprot:scaffold7642_cov210-Pinguiococcus_pyrenoidosus.AAC.2
MVISSPAAGCFGTSPVRHDTTGSAHSLLELSLASQLSPLSPEASSVFLLPFESSSCSSSSSSSSSPFPLASPSAVLPLASWSVGGTGLTLTYRGHPMPPLPSGNSHCSQFSRRRTVSFSASSWRSSLFARPARRSSYRAPYCATCE